MRTKLLPCLTVLVIFLSVFLLGTDPALAVMNQFTVQLPDRGTGKRPIGRVKITLQSASDPSLSTLTIPGHSVPLSPSEFGVPLDNGDFVFFDTVVGTNNVVIDYQLWSLYSNDPAYPSKKNYCSSTATFPLDLSLTFDGPSVMGHRLSSYVAQSTFNCGCADRTVNASAAFFTDSPSTNNLGRHPLDVVLVLDESGSMGSTVAGTSMSKMGLLQQAVSLFVDEWRLDGTGVADDRLGVVMFTTDKEALEFGPAQHFLVERGAGLANSTSHPWAEIKAKVNSRSPTSLTALGKGIQEAIDKWKTSPNPNEASLLIFTNGIQNVDPRVIPPSATQPFVTLNGIALADNCKLHMQTIGIGAPSDIQAELLDEIANQTGGIVQIVYPRDMPETPDTFTNSLVEMVKGDTLELVARRKGVIASGQNTGLPESFTLNPTVSQGMFVLDWRSPPNALTLEIRDPNGNVVQSVSQLDDPFHTVQTVNLPTGGPHGDWSVIVKRDPALPTGLNVKYTLTLLVVEEEFSYHLSFAKSRYETGDTIVLRAELSQGGTPLDGLDGALMVTVSQPSTALGSYLFATDVSDQTLTTNPPGTHPDQFPTPASRKLFHLVESTDLAQLITPQPTPQTFLLLDNGDPTTGDGQAGDGVYSMTYSSTRIPGQYVFDVSIDANVPGTGQVKRAEHIETKVVVGDADPDDSEVAFDDLSGGNYFVTILPADKFGNFYGPEYEDAIDVQISGGGMVVPPITDKRANGSYTLHISGVPEDAEPTVRVTVRGTKIYDDRIDDKPDKPFAVFAGVGATVPHGSLDNSYNTLTSWQGGFEYRFTNRLSLEATLGLDQFDGDKPGKDDLNIGRLSVDGKFYLLIGTFQLGGFAGPEIYYVEDDGVRGGVNVGAVAEYRLTTQWSLETTAALHKMFIGDGHYHTTVGAQLRYRF